VSELLRQEMQAGERLLWRGRPDIRRWLEPQDALLIPFSVAWGGLMIYWEVTAVFGRSTRSSVLLVICGIPFLLAAVYLLLGRFFVRRWSLARTSFAITDRRAISITPAFRAGSTVRSVWFASYPPIERRSARAGRGTIVVGYLPAGPRSFMTDPGWPGGGRVARAAVIFNGIDAPDSVYRLLKDQLAAYGSPARLISECALGPAADRRTAGRRGGAPGSERPRQQWPVYA
jgi:hypothetical protein